MKALLAILGALGGGFLGVLVAFIIIYPILVSIEGGDMNGGLAMGVAMGVAPLCAIIGAVLGLLFVLRVGRAKEPAKEKVPSGEDRLEAANLTDDEKDAALLAPPSGKRPSMFDTQALIAIAIVGVALFAGWKWLFDDGAPPHFPVHGAKPVMEFELKVPTSAIVESDFFRVRTELRSWHHSISPNRRVERDDGQDGMTLITGAVELSNKIDQRSLQVWLSDKSMLEFDLSYAKVPDAEEAFGPWRRVSRIEYYQEGRIDDNPSDEFFLRTRMTWPGS